jgi:hypothetical protein
MATTTLTPTSAATESPKLVKKPSVAEVEKKAPTMATQTKFGCRGCNDVKRWNDLVLTGYTEHIQNLLKNAGEKATDNYGRIMKVVRDSNNISGNVYKNGEGAKATGDVSYLCFQCPNVTNKRQAHRKDHIFCEQPCMCVTTQEKGVANTMIQLSSPTTGSSSAMNVQTSSTILLSKLFGQAMPRRGSTRIWTRAKLSD